MKHFPPVRVLIEQQVAAILAASVFHATRRGLAADAEVVRHRGGGDDGEEA